MRCLTTAQLNTTTPYSFWGARLTHSAAANATVTNGAGTVEVGRVQVTATVLEGGFLLPTPIAVVGLAATVSAGTLNVYVD